MTEQINPDILKSTQDILGKFIKKPTLTEKLLSKPPFRFLHDIVNAVNKEHQCLKGLYTADELNSQNIKDRDGKVEFLHKLVDVLNIATNQKLSVRPSKIVSGHEADKTNQMLQVLGNVIENNIDCSDAIKSVLSKYEKKEKPKSKDDKKLKDEKKIKADSKSVKEGKKIEKNAVPKQTEPLKTTRSTKSDTPNQSNKNVKTKIKSDKEDKTATKYKNDGKRNNIEKNRSSTTREKLPRKTNSIETKLKKELSSDGSKFSISNEEEDKVSMENEKIQEIDENVNVKVFSHENKNSSKVDIESSDQLIQIESNEFELKEEIKKKIEERKENDEKVNTSIIENSQKLINDQNTSDTSNQVLKEKTNHRIETEQNFENKSKINPSEPKSELKRQSTFVREDSKENVSRPRTSLRPPSVRPPSARPGAPRRRDKNVEIILQPNEPIKLGGIQVKVNSYNVNLEDDGENLVIIENSTNQEVDLINVESEANPLETGEDLQQGHLVQQILETQKELAIEFNDKNEDLDLSRIQQRQNSAKQMNSLRDIIQNLTKSVNPLGKLMDFIPEDIDSMQLELTMWHDIYSEAYTELKKEKSLTETAIKPMKNQLIQIDDNIKEYQEMIDNTRAKILQNTDKIFNLLTE